MVKRTKFYPLQKKKYFPTRWKERGIMKGRKSSCIWNSAWLYFAENTSSRREVELSRFCPKLSAKLHGNFRLVQMKSPNQTVETLHFFRGNLREH